MTYSGDPGALFDQIRSVLDADQTGLLVEQLTEPEIAACLSMAQTRMQPQHIRGGPTRLIAMQLQKSGRRRATSLSATLLRPMIEAVREELGDAADDPSSDDLLSVLNPLIQQYSELLAYFLITFVAISDMTASEAALDVLELISNYTEKAQQPEPSDEDEAESIEHDPVLFTTLDEAVIRSVVAACSETIGAFSRADTRALVDEVVKLNSARHASWFHVGFLDALDDDWTPDLPVAGMNDERRTWLVFGRLSGLTRRQAWGDIARVCLDDWASVEAVISDAAMGNSMTAPVVQSLLQKHPRRAADALAVRQGIAPFLGWQDTLRQAHERARTLLNEESIPEAKALWVSLSMYPSEIVQDLHIDVNRRLITCARAADDFTTATRLLDETEFDDLPASERAVFHTERGLVAAEFQHLRHVTLDPEKAGENLVARLERGEKDFEAALTVDRYEWRANLCLGVLELFHQKPTASTRLYMALSGMQDDPVLGTTPLPDEVRFHAALSRLRSLEPGSDGPAYADLTRSLDGDWRPTPHQVLEAGQLLQAYSSPHAADWLVNAVPRTKRPGALAVLALDLVQDGEERVVETARKLGRSRKVDPETRMALLTGILEHVTSIDDETTDAVLDEIDELLSAVEDAETDRQFAQWLSTVRARELLGAPEARLRQVDTWRRLGNTAAARDVLEELIHRVLNDPGGSYQGVDLLEMLKELDPKAGQIERLARLVAPREATAAPATSKVRLLFVGGDERQRVHRDDIDAKLSERHNGRVTVKWIFPGWGSNWVRHAEEAESWFPKVDVLVLMPFVRTNLGRRLRRSCGDTDTPWVACTGHGKDSMFRALEEAVAVSRGDTGA